MNDSRKARSIKEDFIVYLNEDKIQTDFNCPHCNQGYLYIDNNLSIYRVNKEYENNLEYFIESPPYIYDYTSQISGFLKCNDCEQEVSFIGEIKGGIITYNNYEYGEMDLEEELLYFKYFYPPINLIELKNEYPNTIKDILKESFSLFYNHKEACINELKKVWKFLVNNLCDKVKIEQKNDLKTKMEKLVLKHRYSRIKKDLMLLQYLYNSDFDIPPYTIYLGLENILTFIYKDKYPYISPLIITEGKTDWKHLKKALERFQTQGIYLDLNIQFEEYEQTDMGDSALDSMCTAYAKTQQSKKHIFMFDRDNHKYTKKYAIEEFNNHENDVYSFCIPKISDELDEISIEFYYKKDDIKTEDKFGKRIFLGDEFRGKGDGNSKCGKYVTEKRNAVALDIIDRDKKVFIRDDIKKENNIALSKNYFTNNIINEVEGFDNFDIDNFKLIFDVIEKIVND
jgi:RNA-directed DNA polymerase